MDSFRAYLEQIFVSDVVIDRISTLYELYKPILPEDVKDIFVENFKNKTGEYEYASLFLFSEKYQMEIPNFMSLDQISIYPLTKNVDFLKIITTNYDLKKINSTSEINVEYSLGVIEAFETRAIGKNCDYLRDIITRYLVPNLAS